MVQSRREDKLACSPKKSNVTDAHAGATYLKARFPPLCAVAMYLACPLNLSAQLYCTAACRGSKCTRTHNDRAKSFARILTSDTYQENGAPARQREHQKPQHASVTEPA